MATSTRKPDVQSAEWGFCLAVGLGTFAIGALLLLSLIVLIDPYDRGYFGLLKIVGIDDRTVTGNASRARDLQFDSALLSNSTGQLIDPGKLSAGTGYRFVQLLVPGGQPKGLLATLDYFLRHHQHVGALVMVVDDPWCSQDAKAEPDDRFPYWLYEESMLAYAAHVWNWSAIDHLVRRIEIGLGLRVPMRADGHWSYEDILPSPQMTLLNQAPAAVGREAVPSRPNLFPSRDQLALAIGKLPVETPVILIIPPVFHTLLPEPQSAAAARRSACKAAFEEVIAGRPQSDVIDYRRDNESTRDPRNFVDPIHYRARIGDAISGGIVAKLGGTRGP